VPLPPSVPREEVHCRRIEMRGYRRTDGMYDIEGRLVDTKSHPFQLDGAPVVVAPGAHHHDMWVRIVVDEEFTVREVHAVSDATPYAARGDAPATLQALVGARIARGWSATVKERLGGARSCTHLMEMMIPLATAAWQSMISVRRAKPEALDANGRPVKIDSCYAYASDREMVRLRWPGHYTGGRS
jgi:hypothetical protein